MSTLGAVSTPPLRDQALEALLDSARPVLQSVIRRRLGGSTADPRERQSVDDAYAETVGILVRRFRTTAEAEPARDIRNISAFAAATASHVCDAYVRRRYPLRARLRRRLLYLLDHRSAVTEFAAWSGATGERWCGLTVWRGQAGRSFDAGDDLEARVRSSGEISTNDIPSLLRQIFRSAAMPLELEGLVTLCASLLEMREEPSTALEEEAAFLAVPGPEDRAAQREYLALLWAEIGQLPAPQCAALLLNLRGPNGQGLIALLPILRIASFDDLAASLQMDPDQLAVIWNELPLDDQIIAARLGKTRQQVINLQLAARNRLTRRMRDRWSD